MATTTVHRPGSASRRRPSRPRRSPQARARTALLALLAGVLVTAGAFVLLAGGHLVPGAAATDAPGAPPGSDDGAAQGASALDAELVARFDAAAAAAAEEGIDLRITSGLRTAEEQQRLFDEAVAEHGSPEEASRWVLPPERSGHVRGTAIDVGGYAGMTWLAEHGVAYGLCQVYANEPWHFEALVEPGGTCPALQPDASSAT